MTTIPIPADLGGAPLGELKQWLAISGTNDDALLTRLLESAYQMCIQFTGIEPGNWADLDEALRHGIIRYAAHHYRERDLSEAGHIPAAVAALWRPWRSLRL